MADESSSIALQLTINLRGLTKLTQLNAALKELKTNALGFQRSLKSGNDLLKEQSDIAGRAAKSLKDLNKANGDAAKKIAKQNPAQDTNKVMSKAFADAQKAQVKEVQNAEKQKQAIRDRALAVTAAKEKADLARYTAVIRRKQQIYADQIEAQKTLAGRLGMIESQYDPIFRAGFRLQMVGRNIQQVGQQAIGVLQSMASEFGKFEFMVNRAAGAMGIATDEIDKGTNVYDKFQQTIERAASDLRLFDPTDVAKATYFWASTTGQQVDTLEQLRSVMSSVNPLMKIAAMTETDYETAIKGVYSIIVQYGLKLSDVQQVTEKLHSVTQLTAAEFPDLINSFKMVGPVAAANNVTFDDMVVLLGRLADAGIRGSMSGRALRQMFIQLNKPSEKAAAALDELWKSTEQFGGKSYAEMVFPKGQFVGVTKYVDLLATATKNLTQHERNALLAQITTANELPVLTALVQKATDAQNGLVDATQKIGDIGAEAPARFQKAWELLAQSWLGVVGKFQRGVEILRIQIGRRVAEVFKPALETLGEQFDRISAWIDDPSNQAVIDFFVKLVGFSGAILAVAGSITVFVGAMVSLGAAIKVGVGAFGPLIGRFLTITGVLGTIFTALVRNFDYIKKTASEIFANLSKAMGDSTNKVDGLSKAFEALSATTAPVFDVLIHTIGQTLLLLSELAKMFSKNEQAMGLLTVAAQALGVILSVKILKTMFGLVNVVGMLNGPLNLLVKAFGGLIVPVTAFDGVLGRVPSRLDRFKSSLNGLKSSIGPGGWFSIAIVSLTLAYENNLLGFKDFVDTLFFDVNAKIKETLGLIADAQAEAGKYSPSIEKGLMTDPEFARRKKQVEELQNAYDQGMAGNKPVGFGSMANIQHNLAQAKLDLDTFTKDYYQTVKDWVDEVNALGNHITFEDFMARVNQEIANGAGTWRDATSRAFNYFSTLAKGMQDYDRQAQRIMADISRGSTRTGGPDDTNKLSEDMMAALKSQLVELRSKASPEVQQQISDMLSGALVNVPDDADVTGATDQMAKTVWGDIANTMLTEGQKAFDIDKILTDVMKKTISPNSQASAIFKSFATGVIAKGFHDAKGNFSAPAALTARQAMSDFVTAWQVRIDHAKPANAKKFAANAIKEFKTAFKNGIPKEVPQDMVQMLYDFVSKLYTEAGKPMDPDIIAMFKKRGIEIPGYVSDGVNSNKGKAHDAGKAVVAAASKGITDGKSTLNNPITQVQNKIDDINKFGAGGTSSTAYTWGQHLVQNLSSGMMAAIGSAIGAAISVAIAIFKVLHQTTADEGPLKDTDVWGTHLVQNITDGIYAGIPEAARASTQLAAAISRGYEFANDSIANGGVSIESNAQRVIKVEVEVTSPDGSVSRIQAAQFEKAMMSNELISSIEHMATVG